ncbi:MAG: thiamine phosphate synthase [Candidatus Accumulibacter sp.]|uniref:thiamine phosphate synthase n=1 Tax=Accumulibacter sp. TaxID=2053492 RepID=UPI002878D776|nr:thiamine phosphate synthase [Accumulibacter sp.]MDS4012784.1 thiamine phosphate synthase [Accumulibacter sp.]
MTAARRRPLRGLYAITPEGLTRADLLLRVRAALAGGAVVVQYRDKLASDDERRATASALRALCREFAAPLLINDDLDLALAIDADGVHLGRDDGDWCAARRRLGPDRLLGCSCYADAALARQAVLAGADYLALGAVFPSATKPLAVRADLSLFAHCRQEFALPICAIGGITLENAPRLLAAGADLLAVISDLFAAPEVMARAAAYQNLFKDISRDFP